MWLFIVSDAITFSAVIFAYGYLRLAAAAWPRPFETASITNATVMTFVLLSSSVAMVLAVTGIVVTTAAPSLTQLIEARRIDGVASQMASDLQFARAEAVLHNQGVRISFKPEAACYVVHTGAAVLDRQQHVISLLEVGGQRVLRRAVGGADAQLPAQGHRVTRVDGEVENHVLDLRRVDQGRPKFRIQLCTQLDPAAERGSH